jgi:hypothetical protein
MWTLRSSSGTDSYTFRLVGTVAGSSSETVWEVDLITTFKDRSTESGLEVEEHLVRLPQLLIPRENLRQLDVSIRKWLLDFEPFSVGLATRPGQQMQILVGPSPALISTRSRPAVEITYAGISLEFRAFCVVDQSCMRVAAEELTQVLRSV